MSLLTALLHHLKKINCVSNNFPQLLLLFQLLLLRYLHFTLWDKTNAQHLAFV